jgi:hypothetical protein
MLWLTESNDLRAVETCRSLDSPTICTVVFPSRSLISPIELLYRTAFFCQVLHYLIHGIRT